MVPDLLEIDVGVGELLGEMRALRGRQVLSLSGRQPLEYLDDLGSFLHHRHRKVLGTVVLPTFPFAGEAGNGLVEFGAAIFHARIIA